MMSAFFYPQLHKVILTLDYPAPLPRKKLPLKSPATLGLNIFEFSHVKQTVKT